MAHGGKRAGAGRKPGKVSAAKRSIMEKAKSHGDAALRTLVEIAKNKDEQASARVSAANALLDRGYGKPVQGVDHSSSDGSMSPKPTINMANLSTEALAEIVALSDAPDAD